MTWFGNICLKAIQEQDLGGYISLLCTHEWRIHLATQFNRQPVQRDHDKWLLLLPAEDEEAALEAFIREYSRRDLPELHIYNSIDSSNIYAMTRIIFMMKEFMRLNLHRFNNSYLDYCLLTIAALNQINAIFMAFMFYFNEFAPDDCLGPTIAIVCANKLSCCDIPEKDLQAITAHYCPCEKSQLFVANLAYSVDIHLPARLFGPKIEKMVAMPLTVAFMCKQTGRKK